MNAPAMIDRLEALEWTPLSFAQQRLWFFSRLETSSTAYNIGGLLRFKGVLDLDSLRHGLDQVYARHAALRTVFREHDGLAQQAVLAAGSMPLEIIDLQGGAEGVEALARDFIEAKYDLVRGPLIRCALYRFGEGLHAFAVAMHHIISDAWSVRVLVEEMAEFYRARLQSRQPFMTPQPLQYSEYAAGQRQWLDSEAGEQQMAFWREQLGGEQPPLSLVPDYLHSAQAARRAAYRSLKVESALVARLSDLAKSQGVTLFTVLLAALQLQLARLSGLREVRVGVPVAGRAKGSERLVGFFVNTLVLKAQPRPELSVGDWLSQVRTGLKQAQANQQMPFERLVEELAPSRSLGQQPLFQVAFNYRRQHPLPANWLPGIETVLEELPSSQIPFDLALDAVRDKGDVLSINFAYAADLFAESSIERLIGGFIALLEGFVARPMAALGELELVGQAQQRLLDEWNKPRQHFDATRLLPELIAEQARNRPGMTALVHGSQRLSYSELDSQSNLLARLLIARGVRSESRVGVSLERGNAMIVAMLAVLKSGGAFVPLDPDYPRDRLSYMVEDSGLKWLITSSDLAERLPLSEGVEVLPLDLFDLSAFETAPPVVQLHPLNLAYLIYTSGSTGQPKGVAVNHLGLSMHVQTIGQRYGMTPDDVELHFASISFDGALERWTVPLAFGSRLVIRDQELWSAEKTCQVIADEGVTISCLPPSYAQQLLDWVESQNLKLPVRSWTLGGEAFTRETYERLQRVLEPKRIINGYGPTETVVTPLIWEAFPGDSFDAAYAPIGNPVGPRSLYVLDAELNLLPIGVAGELYIGGEVGLARGYFQRPELTAERFLPDPFGAAGERMYRTGDLVRWRADGTLDYLGRVDHQVKIRGFRIELGEIESQLLALEGVQEAAVIARETPTGKQLVGYVVARDNSDVNALRAELAKTLPDYMVPAQIIALAKLPLTPAGKLDRAALPEPTWQSQDYEAPQTDHERILAAIWAEVLGVERVGRQDHFFELGGDSIVALQVVSRARQQGLGLTPKDLFQQQTLAQLAGVARLVAAPLAEQGPVTGTAPLLPIQARLLAREGLAPCNQYLLLELAEPLQAAQLEQALQALVQHHDALRLRIERLDGQWQQVHAAEVAGPLLQRVELAAGEDPQPHYDAAQRSIDPASGSHLRGLYLTQPGQTDRLLLSIHHLVVDGVSWRVLLEDLQRACLQLASGLAVQLPAKTSAFKTWGERLVDWNMDAQLPYWQAQQTGGELPLQSQEAGTEGTRKRIELSLEAGFTRDLLQAGQRAYRLRADELLLTALSRALCSWSEQPALTLHLESHGRAPLFEDIDLSRSVGWFTSLYPVRLQPEAELGASLKAIKEQLRAVPDLGLGFGQLAQQGQLTERAPQLLFNYLGQFDEGEGGLRLREGGLWREADAPMDAPLVINAEQRGGALQLHIDFNPAQLARTTLEGLVARLQDELHSIAQHCAKVSPRLTPSDVPLAGLSQVELDALAGVEDIHPLSPLQQGLLFHSQLEGAGSYVSQLLLPFTGLDPQRLQNAWRQVLARHGVLRSRFLLGERPLQLVQAEVELDWQELDWRGVADFEAQLQAFCSAERERGFALDQSPLLRLALIQRGARDFVLVWTLHHLLLDGWSNGLLFAEVLALYHGDRLPAPGAQFRDYIHWLEGQDAAAEQAFWREQLAPLDGATRIAGCLPCRAPEQGHARHPLPLDSATEQHIRGFAQRHGLTLNTLVQAAWALLLARLTGKRSLCFGATVAGRPTELAGSEQMLGLFINSLPVAVQLPAEQPLGDWLAALQVQNLQLREHEHSPLHDIQRWVGSAGEALFDSLLVFENYPLGEALKQAERGELRLGLPQSHEFTHYPMTLAVLPGSRLELLLAYGRAHFDAAGIAQVETLLRQALAQVCGDPARALGSLQLSSADEQARLAEWNMSRQSFDASRLLPELIAEQARLRPETIALVHGGERIAFAELESRSNQLANLLVSHGVQPESRVGVSLERGNAMIVAMLAVLKAGGAFVPLDPDYPRERLSYMVEDSGLKWLITSSDLAERLPLGEGVEPLYLDRLDLSAFESSAPSVELHPLNLAYLIYTSGSTGQPKGVAVNHLGLSMHVQTIGQRYGMTPDDVELHFASISFDGALERWTVPLAFGSRLVIRDQELWSAEKTCQVIADEGVTISCLPPSYAQQLLDWVESQNLKLPVRSWTLGGEAFTRETYERLQKVLQPQRIINGYGPTETVVTPLIWEAYPGDSFEAAYAPIGNPVGPRSLYVLDAELNLLPIGVAGELYIGGEVGLARGYFQRPELTAERFLPDPFGQAGERMYRTGDLVRWRADGTLDYLGRVDHQVKIRGFRIELGEIESQLLALEGVQEAAVIARETPTGKQLVGYVVARDNTDTHALRGELAKVLPDYMVPAQIIALEKLPLTPAGKLDRAALPEPIWQSQDYEAPQTDNERILAAIWAEVLGVERVGRQDHFFELGGDSIVALKVVSRIRQQGLQLPLKALFEQSRLADCAASLQREAVDAPVLRALPRGSDLPLSHAQQRLWFLNRLDPSNGAYHMPAGLDLQGRLDRQALQAAFDQLEARHEALRTRFVEVGGEARQRILAPQGQRIDWFDLRELPASEREIEARDYAQKLLTRPFNLASEPLLRVSVLRLADQEYRLLLVQHHIVSDGWSMQRFIGEFAAAYAAFAEGRTAQFAPLPLQYADYAQWQRDWLKSSEATRQLDYWKARLGEHQPLLELPTDHPRPALGARQGMRWRFELSPLLTAQLRALAQREGSTLFSLLLAAWQTLLHRYSGQEDIRVGVPVAGRSLAEMDGVLGCFINTLVLRGEPAGLKPFRELLGELAQASRDALANQELPFDQLVEALQPTRSLSHHPLFQVAFNHQQVDFSALGNLPGLRVQPHDPGAAGAQFDLALDTEEAADGSLSGFVSYAAELFEARTIARLARHFVRLLEGICTDPIQPIGLLPLLEEDEQAQLATWNDTAKDYGPQVFLSERISQQAARTPQAPALVFGEQTLSYAELEARINQLANRLRSLGVQRGSLVGISLERSLELVIGLHAIVRAGAAYVPLDPEYPLERLAYLLEDSGVDLLLSHSALVERLPLPAGLKALGLDREDCSAEPVTPPAVSLQGNDLAYVIYTSGSTGKPKGAGNSHEALANRMLWMQEAYQLGAGDVVLQKTPFSFDVSVWEFFWPLVTGACLVVAAPGDHRDPQKLVEMIQRHKVSTLHFVPSMLQAFLLHPDVEQCQSLTRVICSGEALPAELQMRTFQRLPQAGLYNLYGPTEAAIDVSHWTCVEEGRHAVPIGRPIANLRLHILDAQLNPVPQGVPGELYIAGIGLARGYHRRPELTAERFLPDPFSSEGGRMYRTGDLVRWRADGAIDYLGRIDHQVKIRGFRVELGEIEAQLGAQPGVAEAVVVARDSQIGKQLVGYLVAELLPADENAWLAGIKAALKSELPEHMVPSILMRLERMPLSPNGKLERRALPEPVWQARVYRAPQSEREIALAAIWQEVLEVAQVGLDDNFFELGGHSLLATQAVALLRQRLGLELPLRAFFEAENLAALAANLDGQAPAAAEEEDQDLRDMAALLDELEAL
ncbi:amino acid adenylation domain-containing protein/non-ribosomal peptide synthase protein (TIGR01720 family) [Pseudomonas fluvialis]|uniref:Amino acid adenylation domain-containing protein/non-ribosomal peptide synthase protein (TIGR01720 family) n=1 Tax=Pseudomonas fluvialis TaxID=1793966 RepID=A0A7X0BTV1_9PSED|nr:non-ribosomal peptide synthetase [Pseudomonas fluvialis]MBB6342368.1 amino acid adenylation domain-containing protein/non-ribosomal peptide synthase protein (TIGR01720 family) [Pseudomonas fluvialis]